MVKYLTAAAERSGPVRCGAVRFQWRPVLQIWIRNPERRRVEPMRPPGEVTADYRLMRHERAELQIPRQEQTSHAEAVCVWQ